MQRRYTILHQDAPQAPYGALLQCGKWRPDHLRTDRLARRAGSAAASSPGGLRGEGGRVSGEEKPAAMVPEPGDRRTDSGRRLSFLRWPRESPPDFPGRESAPGLPGRPGSGNHPEELAVRTERKRFQIGIGHPNERGDRIPLDRENDGTLLRIADTGRDRSACVSELQRLHRLMTALPIRTAFRSLTPTARTTTTGSGSMTTSKYTRRLPSRSSCRGESCEGAV